MSVTVDLDLLREEPSTDPVADLARGIDLLNEVKGGERGATLRIYRPSPTLAFGQRDVRLPGFEAARMAALRHGFEPVVRKAGGRAAAYHQGTLIIDHVQPEPDAMLGHTIRFQEFGALFADALRSVGVDAHIGELPGEYCAGEYSVYGTSHSGTASQYDAAASVKLVGTAQRVVTGAWLFTSVLVVTDSAPLRSVLDEVYQALEIPMDPRTVGAVEDLVPGMSVDAVTESLLNTYRGSGKWNLDT
ncbi:lipoate-protein ligase A [Neomicrococcus aestuarii]|uniref:Lipoate-protein ligase A n=1 Tax=Neomicrococcus aestuarii TaxID=556325 RepID=A0A7W8TSC5_9MICC|nr:lipoate--protein ligase family protein [Neomicrococcus aestuarii]MBB5512042.1 lipoate-protein ligase A [Neomicrococcus aestuarii]